MGVRGLEHPTFASGALLAIAAGAVLLLPVDIRTPAAGVLYLGCAAGLGAAARRATPRPSPWAPVAGAAAAMAGFQLFWGSAPDNDERSAPMAIGALVCLSIAICLGGIGGWRGARPWMSFRPARPLVWVATLAGLAGFAGLGLSGFDAAGDSVARGLTATGLLVAATMTLAIAAIWPEARRVGRRADLIGILVAAVHIGLCTIWWRRGQPLGDPISGLFVYGALALLSNTPAGARIGGPIDHRPLVTNPSTLPAVASLMAALALQQAIVQGVPTSLVVGLSVATVGLLAYAARALGSSPATPLIPLTRSARIRSELAGALVGGDIVLRYRPVFRLSDGAFAGVDAAPVWHHRTLGEIGEPELRREANRIGLATAVDIHLIDTAIPNVASINGLAGTDEPWLSVPISVESLHSEAFVEKVGGIVDAWEASYDGLALVVPDLPGGDVAERAIRALQDRGVWIASPARSAMVEEPSELDADLVVVEARLGSYDPRLLQVSRGHRVVVTGLESDDSRRRALRLGAAFASGGEPLATLAEIFGRHDVALRPNPF